MTNPWWTIRDQMDDRKRFLLKKIKRWKKWSCHLNNESNSKIQKQPTSRYEGGLLSRKNKKMESPPKQETNQREVADMTKYKVMKEIQMMPKNVESASSNVRWERMMRNENMNVVETPGTEKLSPWQQRQKMLSHRLSRQRSARRLSPWSPISPFKPVSHG